MPKGENENIAKSEDYQFVDPTGQFQGQLDQFGNMAQFGQQGLQGAFTQDMQGPQFGDSNAAYNQFLGQSGGLSNLAAGPNAQLTQQLNAIASRQANAGMQNAMTQFQGMGAGRSGAANRAMGEAAANPFADVAAQQQQNQLNLTGNLWNTAFGQAGQQQLQGNELTNQNIMQQNQLQNALLRQRAQTMGSIYGQGMQGAGQMASEMGGMMAPQYEYQPSPWENFAQGAGDVATIGASAKIIFMCLHPKTRVDTAHGKRVKVKRLRPGTEIVDAHGDKCSVIGVVKYRERSEKGFFRITTSLGKAYMCDAHETIDRRTIKEGLHAGEFIKGVRIRDITPIKSPKYSYDIITSGKEDSYRLEGLPVRGMTDRIVNRGRRV